MIKTWLQVSGCRLQAKKWAEGERILKYWNDGKKNEKKE